MTANKFQDLKNRLYADDPEAEGRVAAKTEALREQLGLSELRASRERTQTELARTIGTTQSGVSRLERQDDLLISTLRDYVAATGGRLRLVATYDDFETDIDVPALHPSPAAPREFRVVWQNPLTRHFVHVGWLQFDGSQYTYTYTPEAELDDDFTTFPAFPDFRTTYRSSELFEFFESRIANAAGGRIALAQALGLGASEATPVELLARSWGQDIHDTVQVVPEPVIRDDGTLVRMFLTSGARHANEENPEAVSDRISHLQSGDRLTLRAEPDNPVNDHAIVVDASGQPVGWIPDYLLGEVHKQRDAGLDIDVFVEHANGPDVGWHLRLLCRMEASRA